MAGRISQLILEDMLIRDERALAWITSEKCRDGMARFTYRDLAAALRCHENTATAIVRRLIGAGHLLVIARQYDGYTYQVMRLQ